MKIVIVLITISIVSRMTRWHNILEFSFILCILCFMRMVIAPAAARNPGSSIIRQNKDLPPIPTQANDLKASFFTVFQLGNTPMLLPSPNVSANCFNDSIHYVNYITEILFALTIHQKGPLPPIPQWAITSKYMRFT